MLAVPDFSLSDSGGGCNSTGGEECVSEAGVVLTDPEEKCVHYESGNCLAQFDTTEYTSIVSEVCVCVSQ